MKALIVDDNKIARTTMRHLAGQIKDLEVTGDVDSAIAAYNFI